MRSQNRDFMPSRLEAHCSVDDQAFCSSDAEVGVDEDDVSFRSFGRLHCNMLKSGGVYDVKMKINEKRSRTSCL